MSNNKSFVIEIDSPDSFVIVRDPLSTPQSFTHYVDVVTLDEFKNLLIVPGITPHPITLTLSENRLSPPPSRRWMFNIMAAMNPRDQPNIANWIHGQEVTNIFTFSPSDFDEIVGTKHAWKTSQGFMYNSVYENCAECGIRKEDSVSDYCVAEAFKKALG